MYRRGVQALQILCFSALALVSCITIGNSEKLDPYTVSMDGIIERSRKERPAWTELSRKVQQEVHGVQDFKGKHRIFWDDKAGTMVHTFRVADLLAPHPQVQQPCRDPQDRCRGTWLDRFVRETRNKTAEVLAQSLWDKLRQQARITLTRGEIERLNAILRAGLETRWETVISLEDMYFEKQVKDPLYEGTGGESSHTYELWIFVRVSQQPETSLLGILTTMMQAETQRVEDQGLWAKIRQVTPLFDGRQLGH